MTEMMLGKVSDIEGKGYGDKHKWVRGETIQSPDPFFRETRYICDDCKAIFWHQYHVISDIFDAMKYKNVPEECKENK